MEAKAFLRASCLCRLRTATARGTPGGLWFRRRFTPSAPGNVGCRPATGPGALSPFDRQMKRKQKNWAAGQPHAERCEYLREEVEEKEREEMTGRSLFLLGKYWKYFTVLLSEKSPKATQPPLHCIVLLRLQPVPFFKNKKQPILLKSFGQQRIHYIVMKGMS